MIKHLFILILILNISNYSLFAIERTNEIKNQTKNVKGRVFYKNSRGEIKRLENNFNIKKGQVIYTGCGSSVEIHFEDKSTFKIGSLSVILVDQLVSNQKPGQSRVNYKSKFKLKIGSVTADVKRKAGDVKKFEVETPAGVASVRGTKEEVSYFMDSGMAVKVLSGKVLLLSRKGINKSISKNERTTATKSNIPSFKDEIKLEKEKVFSILKNDKSGPQAFKILKFETDIEKYMDRKENELFKAYKNSIITSKNTSISVKDFEGLKNYQKRLWNTSQSINNSQTPNTDFYSIEDKFKSIEDKFKSIEDKFKSIEDEFNAKF